MVVLRTPLQRLAQYFREGVRTLGTRSEPHLPDAKFPPTSSTYIPRLPGHPVGCTPCRMRNQIRVLMSLVERLDTWQDRTCTYDTDVLARCDHELSRLRVDEVLLRQLLGQADVPAPEAPE